MPFEPVWVLATEESSLLSANMPTAEAIDAAFAALNATDLATGWNRAMDLAGAPVTARTTAEDWGAWAYRRARITRVGGTALSPYAIVTRVADAWVFPDRPFVRGAQAGMLQFLQTNLYEALRARAYPTAALSTWQRVVANPFRESVNGPLADWQNGRMSVTATRSDPPGFGGTMAAIESPIGPTVPGVTTPPAFPDWASAAGRGASSIIWGVAGPLFVIVGGVLVLRYALRSSTAPGTRTLPPRPGETAKTVAATKSART